jgi:hypothetical protein
MRVPATQTTTGAAIRRIALLWLALNLLDALLTYQLLGAGGVEGNPLLAALMAQSGEGWALTTKVAAASVVAGVVLRYGRTGLLRGASLLMAVVVLYNATLALSLTL